MDSIWQDLKFGVRMLGKNPAFAVVAVLTLGLGIGANTAIFSVINAVLLQPLPYRDAAHLIQISGSLNQTAGAAVSLTKYDQVRAQSQTLESTAAYYPLTVSLVRHANLKRYPEPESRSISSALSESRQRAAGPFLQKRNNSAGAM